MPNIVDRAGQRYGRLLVIERAEDRFTSGGKRQVQWRCECDCGRSAIVIAASLSSGKTQSCGCFEQESRQLSKIKHGMSEARVYYVWKTIKQRCTNPSNKGFRNYGGRGITLAPEWRDFNVFLRDMGPRPSDGHSIERIDNDKGYEPGNCIWATRAEQSRNTRRNLRIIYKGREMLMIDAIAMSGLPYNTVYNRYRYGWRGDDLFMPVGSRRRLSNPTAPAATPA